MLPATREIAKNFEPLSAAQTEFVHDYCVRRLIARYPAVGFPNYFEKRRIWNLSLYDHLGKPTQYFYLVEKSEIMRVSEPNIDTIGWHTELPVSKLFSALQNGEALTSMYIRINDGTFASDVERDLAKTEPTDDPLIRCLFTGVVGGYQTAQLRRLQKHSLESISIPTLAVESPEEL